MAPPLRLVRGAPREPGGESPPVFAALIALALLALALLATLLGADPARERTDPRELGREIARLTLERGSSDEEVRTLLLELRGGLARRPLDSRTRVVFADLMLGLGRSVADREAALFHARLAASHSPVTVPVVRSSALVLARGGRAEEALDLIRTMFDYDPGAASRLLLRAEPLIPAATLPDGLPDDPDAWSAWFLTLKRAGRTEDAERWMVETYERWPDHLPTLQNMADRAVRADDLEALARLFPSGLVLPPVPAAAPVLAYRARFKGALGDLAGAREDLREAVRLGDGAASVSILAGEGHAAIGDVEEARRLWSTVLYSIPATATETRTAVHLHLARLEQRHGEAAVALRHWRSVLELQPDNAEANARVEELTGVRR